jgi:hypothetical protein
LWLLFSQHGDRILLGGGRNLDFETETTTEFAQTEIIQNRLTFKSNFAATRF